MTRGLGVLAATAALAVLGCRAIPAPANGILSLSTVELAAPAVVVGDTMRDSLGNAVPLRLYAFGSGGQADTITDAEPTFIVLDRGAHVTQAGYLVGDSARSTPVRIIGSVGVLQTSAVNVFVTPEPVSIAATGATTLDTVIFNGADSSASVNFSQGLGVQVTSPGTPSPVGVVGVIVHYAITYAPAPTGSGASGLLVDAAGHPAAADTTDGSGNASLRIRVRPAAPAAQPDSFVVMASAAYRGVPLTGAPIRFVIPVRSVLAASGGTP
jgi:hypothetical protein